MEFLRAHPQSLIRPSKTSRWRITTTLIYSRRLKPIRLTTRRSWRVLPNPWTTVRIQHRSTGAHCQQLSKLVLLLFLRQHSQLPSQIASRWLTHLSQEHRYNTSPNSSKCILMELVRATGWVSSILIRRLNQSSLECSRTKASINITLTWCRVHTIKCISSLSTSTPTCNLNICTSSKWTVASSSWCSSSR